MFQMIGAQRNKKICSLVQAQIHFAYFEAKLLLMNFIMLRRLIFCTFFLPCFSLVAQNFSGRLIIGMNGSQIDGDGMSGYYKPGLVSGIGVRFPINEKISIGPEIIYSMKGSKASFDQVTKFGYPRIIYRLNYIDIPMVADYRISGGIQAEAGLSYGRLLNAKLDDGTNLGFVDRNEWFKKSDFQILLGLKYEIFDNLWLSGRMMYSVISTNAFGINNLNYGLFGIPSRGGFFNNLLQFTISFHLFGSRPEPGSPSSKPGQSPKS